MATVEVTELVVDGSGALSVLGQYEKGMERAGQATQQSRGALDRYNKAMIEYQAAQEKGLAFTTLSVARRSAEQRAMERWQAQLSKQARLEIQLRREAERAAVDWSNAVALGYAKPAQAVSFLTALEQKHAAQLRDMAAAAQGAAAAQRNLKNRVDATNTSLRTQNAMAGRSGSGFHSTNLLFQMQDIGMMAAMGQAPHILALQQGTQVAGIFHQIGDGKKIVEALGSAFVGLVNPISLATVATIGLGTALFQYLTSADNEVNSLDAALKAHSENIADIKSKWGEAASGVVEYIAKSRDLIQAESVLVGAQMKRQLDEFASGLLDSGDLIRTQAREIQTEIEQLQQAFVLEQALPLADQDTVRLQKMYTEIERLSKALQNASTEVLVAGERFGPFKRELDAFAASVRSGTPDFIRLQDAISRGLLADPANEELQRLTRSINEMIDTGVKLQRRMEANSTAFDVMGTAAGRNVSSVDELRKALERLAGIAVPAMSNREIADAALATGMTSAGSMEERVAVLKRYEEAMVRIRNAEAGASVPTPTARPNDIQRLDWAAAASQRRGRKTDAEKAQESYDKLIRRSEHFIAAQELEQRALYMTEEAAAALRHEQNLLNAAANDNINLTPLQKQELNGLAAAMAAAEAETKRFNDMLNFGRDIAKGALADLRSALSDGKLSWEELGNVAVNALEAVTDRDDDDALNMIIFGEGKAA